MLNVVSESVCTVCVCILSEHVCVCVPCGCGGVAGGGGGSGICILAAAVYISRHNIHKTVCLFTKTVRWTKLSQIQLSLLQIRWFVVIVVVVVSCDVTLLSQPRFFIPCCAAVVRCWSYVRWACSVTNLKKRQVMCINFFLCSFWMAMTVWCFTKLYLLLVDLWLYL